MRHLFLPWILCLLPILGLRGAERPHLVLVMADDQGWGDMAYNGHPVVKTPNFDAAAASGLRFDRFYAAAPVCSPTRASVMTGRHPNRMGVFQWGYPMRPQETTLAEALRTAGYTTGHFGKWHLGSVRRSSPANPGANGFDRWVSAENFYDNDATLSNEGTAVRKTGESSAIAVDEALAWMRETVKGGAPLFTVIWFGSPHSPHQAIDGDRAHYPDQPKAIQEFLGEITGMDRAFGRLREALDELGIRDNTLLWYCSDNGALPQLGRTGGARGHKGQIYDGGLLVPAILEWPAKIAAPRAIAARCNTCDIYPTLLEIAGVTMPDQPPVDGVSLLPLIKGSTPAEAPRRKPMGFWSHTARGIGTPSEKWMTELLAAQREGRDLPPNEESMKAASLPDPPHPEDRFPGHAAWIDGDWKLHRIEPKEAGGPIKWEMYDLAADPSESADLMQKKPEKAAAMQPAIESWLRGVAASLNGADYPKN